MTGPLEAVLSRLTGLELLSLLLTGTSMLTLVFGLLAEQLALQRILGYGNNSMPQVSKGSSGCKRIS
jgi:hypothetical protein